MITYKKLWILLKERKIKKIKIIPLIAIGNHCFTSEKSSCSIEIKLTFEAYIKHNHLT